MKLSIVGTLYYSAKYIEEFCSRVSTVASQLVGDDYEIILVDDGSPDNSLNIAINLMSQNNHLKVVELSRNFGHHKAMMTGLDNACGEYVFLIDVDLEEEPELLHEFWINLHQDKKLDVVFGTQKQRRGCWFEQISGNIFYFLFNKLSRVDLPRNPVTARLMKKDYVNALISYREREIFLAGLWAITGFNQKALVVYKKSSSATTYTLKKKISLMTNSITSFSNQPLTFICYMGMLISIFSFAFFIYITLRKFIFGVTIDGWTSIMASVWLLGGGITFSIGIVGVYIAKIFTEVKQRPYTIIRKIYQNDREV